MLVRLLAADPSEFQKDCQSCRPNRCFNKSPILNVKAQGLPELKGLKRADWWNAVEAFQEHFGHDRPSPYAALLSYGICRRSIIDAVSLEAYMMYMRFDGLNRLKDPADYYEQPSKWIDIVNIIESERAKIKAEPNGN